MTSGTATLETALLGIPEVVVYRTLWFQVKLQPYVLKVPWVSLVNLNLGRESVAGDHPVRPLDGSGPRRELRAIVAGGEKREHRMLADFEELRRIVGGPGPASASPAEWRRSSPRKHGTTHKMAWLILPGGADGRPGRAAAGRSSFRASWKYDAEFLKTTQEMKIICIGRNYAAHAAELNFRTTALDAEGAEPLCGF